MSATSRSSTRTTRPETLAEAREALLDGDGAVRFRGGGTKLGWGTPGDAPDHVIDTGGLDRMLEWNASELTATVQAGMPLARLQAELAARRQWLAIDPPLGPSEAATVGGVFAANDSGPRRQRYGSIRELVIGLTVVLSDGAVARAGGKVIKNVAGYDLAKLFCGSLGTLGLIVELTVRLHPLPEASTTLRLAADARAAAMLTQVLLRSPVEPAALDWVGGLLLVRLQGRADGVAAQARNVRDIASDHRCDVDEMACDAEADAWRRLVESLAGEARETVVRAATAPDPTRHRGRGVGGCRRGKRRGGAAPQPLRARTAHCAPSRR